MIQYHGNQETIHFANWALYSGHVNLDTLEADTIKCVGQRAFNENKIEAIAGYLQFIVTDLVDEATGYCNGPNVDDLDHFGNYTEADDFRPGTFRDPAATLFGPCLGDVANRIAFGTVAELILAHKEQPAPSLN